MGPQSLSGPCPAGRRSDNKRGAQPGLSRRYRRRRRTSAAARASSAGRCGVEGEEAGPARRRNIPRHRYGRDGRTRGGCLAAPCGRRRAGWSCRQRIAHRYEQLSRRRASSKHRVRCPVKSGAYRCSQVDHSLAQAEPIPRRERGGRQSVTVAGRPTMVDAMATVWRAPWAAAGTTKAGTQASRPPPVLTPGAVRPSSAIASARGPAGCRGPWSSQG